MLARLQRWIMVSLCLTAFGWAAVWIRCGWPVLGWLGTLTILFIHAPVLGMEFLLLYCRHSNDPTPRANAKQLLRAWWNEVLTFPRVFYWRQPFRAEAEPNFFPNNAAGRRGVVLIHGFACNRGLWNPWLQRLRAKGNPFVAVNLEPVFGSIDTYATTVEHAVQQVEKLTGLPPLLVAHSMGGLAIRAWMHKNAHNEERVQRVMTIASPHHGTWLGRFAHSINTRQMALKSNWIQQLELDEPPARYTRFTCFYSHCDNIVFPPSTATLPGADNRHIVGQSHVHLAFHPAVFKELMHWLRSSEQAPHDASGPIRYSRTTL